MGAFVMIVISAAVAFLLWYLHRRARDPAADPAAVLLDEVTVPTNFIGYGAFAVSAMVGTAYLLARRGILASRLPALRVLGDVMYKAIDRFAFFTIATILGALWAAEAWNTYWQWDPKETWALIVWLNFATWLHAPDRGLRGAVLAWWAVVGLLVTAFAFIGVNMFLTGLHSTGAVARRVGWTVAHRGRTNADPNPAGGDDRNFLAVDAARARDPRRPLPDRRARARAVRAALDRVLAGRDRAVRRCPRDNSAMDGYAVRAADLSAEGRDRARGGRYRLPAGPSRAWSAPARTVRIMTSATIPSGRRHHRRAGKSPAASTGACSSPSGRRARTCAAPAGGTSPGAVAIPRASAAVPPNSA